MDMPLEQMQANAAEACGLLKSMANESRLMILCQLAEKDMTVGELLANMPLSQSALSQHLAMMRREKIVKTNREAQFIRYSLASREARVLLGSLYDLYCSPDSDKACGLTGEKVTA
jgi:DNA-binding transcriptional ArsR family regulator